MAIHTPCVGHEHIETYIQSEMETPAKSVPTSPWGQKWTREAHLAYFGQPLQNLSLCQLQGKQVKKKSTQSAPADKHLGQFIHYKH